MKENNQSKTNNLKHSKEKEDFHEIDLEIGENLENLLSSKSKFKILIGGNISLEEIANKNIYLAKNNEEAFEMAKFLSINLLE